MLLTSPIWLFALAAIGIPVVIHLWNIRPGRTLKVGSISLFKESSPKSSRSFKLTDILLLALRCLLLALMALLLTGPIWKQRTEGNITKGFILIPEANFTETYRTFQPKIDSLIKVGYEFHYFGNGFKKADLQEALKANRSSGKDTLNYWTLIKQLQSKVPIGTPVNVFTPNTIDHFDGDRPTTSLDIDWQTYTQTDSVSTWPTATWMKADGNIRLIQGTSTATGTSFNYIDLKGDGGGSSYQIDIEKGAPVISSKTDPSEKITADTSIHRFAIYSEKNSADADYLRSALKAIAQLTGQKTEIKMYDKSQAIPAKPDWLFWLSDKPIGASLGQHKNILAYQHGKIQEQESRISNRQGALSRQGEVSIASYRRIAQPFTGESIWTDSYGKPILSKESGATNIYHFYSRFNPQWSDLVWSDEFPKWMMQLTNNIKVDTKHDRRALSNAQIEPIFVKNSGQVSSTAANEPLDRYLWILAAIIFITERWLATRNNPSING